MVPPPAGFAPRAPRLPRSGGCGGDGAPCPCRTAVAVLPSLSSARAQQPQARGPQAPQGSRVVSPEVISDKRVTFRLLAPKAGEVVLNGSWDNGTDIPMTKDAQGIWSVTVGPLGE